jgi:cytidylate kinase
MPIITISRGTFSGGKELAERLASELEYPCISREVIVEAADQYGASEAALSAALSRGPSFLDRFSRDKERYLACIQAVLLQHARQGNFIYHGHGGQHLLAGIRHVVRVRVVADISYRVNHAMKHFNMNRYQAEAHIRKVDKQRQKWTHFLYGVAWDDPCSYDATLNLDQLGSAGACAVVLRLAELEPFQPTEESLRSLGNLALSSRVLAALVNDPRTCGGEFRVRAEDGIVTVDGTAKLQTAAESVVDVVRAVPEVTDVVSQVATVGLPV